MRELESFSIDELVEKSGVDRRTISYYIAEGLLPRVGRLRLLTRSLFGRITTVGSAPSTPSSATRHWCIHV